MRRVRSLGVVAGGHTRPPPVVTMPEPLGRAPWHEDGGEQMGMRVGSTQTPRWDHDGEVLGAADGGVEDVGLGFGAVRRDGDGAGAGGGGAASGASSPSSPRSGAGTHTPRSTHSAHFGISSPVPEQQQALTGLLAHLPTLEEGSKDPTALANWDVVTELEFVLSRVVGEHVLEELMRDKNALRRFRDFIATNLPDSDPLILDFYNDLTVLTSLTTSVRLASTALNTIYLQSTSPSRLSLPLSVRGPILDSLSRCADVGLGLLAPQGEVLSGLYASEWKVYVQEKLVEHVVKELGAWSAQAGGRRGGGEGVKGMADCYCLCNPRLRDNPIVLASEGFASLTGYPLDLIIGRNCRFLQGPGTAPASVKRLHDALAQGKGITSLLLNYRRDGTPFFNLLCMLPLCDAKGEVKYFLGGQIDVTSSLSSLASPFEASSSPSAAPTSMPTSSAHPDFSAAVREEQQRLLEQARRQGVGVMGFEGRLMSGPAVARERERQGAEEDEEGGNGDGDGETLHVRQPSQQGSQGPSVSRHQPRRAPSFDLALGATTPLTAAPAPAPRSPTSSNHSGSGRIGLGLGLGLGGVGKKLKKAASSALSADKKEAGDQLGMTGEEQARRLAEVTQAERDKRGERLMTQLTTFEATYSRVMLIRRSTHEILFVTPQLLEFCGLDPQLAPQLTGVGFPRVLTAPASPNSPTTATADYASERKHRLRRNVRAALEHGHGFSCLVGVKLGAALSGGLKGVWRRVNGEKGKEEADGRRDAVLHLTPLRGREEVEAVVAVFG